MRTGVFALLILGAACTAHAGDERALALASFEAHDDARAIQQLTALVQAQPDDAALLVSLGRAEMRSGATAGAVEHLRRASRLLPRDTDLKIRLAEALAKRIDEVGMFAKLSLAHEVHALLEEAVASDPKHVDAHESLMQFYLDAPGLAGGDRDKAEAETEIVRRLDPGRGHAVDALAFIHDGRTTEAIAAYRAAIAANPADSVARFDLGVYLQGLGRHDEAMDAWEDLLRADPAAAAALYQIGKSAVLSQHRLGRGETALRAYLQPGPRADGDPPPAAAHWRLGMIYELQQRPADARAQYLAALQLDPGFKEARESLERLH